MGLFWRKSLSFVLHHITSWTPCSSPTEPPGGGGCNSDIDTPTYTHTALETHAFTLKAMIPKSLLTYWLLSFFLTEVLYILDCSSSWSEQVLGTSLLLYWQATNVGKPLPFQEQHHWFDSWFISLYGVSSSHVCRPMAAWIIKIIIIRHLKIILTVGYSVKNCQVELRRAKLHGGENCKWRGKKVPLMESGKYLRCGLKGNVFSV